MVTEIQSPASIMGETEGGGVWVVGSEAAEECLSQGHSRGLHKRRIAPGGGARNGEDTVNNTHLWAVTRRGLRVDADNGYVYCPFKNKETD